MRENGRAGSTDGEQATCRAHLLHIVLLQGGLALRASGGGGGFAGRLDALVQGHKHVQVGRHGRATCVAQVAQRQRSCLGRLLVVQA